MERLPRTKCSSCLCPISTSTPRHIDSILSQNLPCVLRALLDMTSCRGADLEESGELMLLEPEIS